MGESELLGVSPDAGENEIKLAYYKSALLFFFFLTLEPRVE